MESRDIKSMIRSIKTELCTLHGKHYKLFKSSKCLRLAEILKVEKGGQKDDTNVLYLISIYKSIKTLIVHTGASQ